MYFTPFAPPLALLFSLFSLYDNDEYDRFRFSLLGPGYHYDFAMDCIYLYILSDIEFVHVSIHVLAVYCLVHIVYMIGIIYSSCPFNQFLQNKQQFQG